MRKLLFLFLLLIASDVFAARRFSITSCDVSDRVVSRIVRYKAQCTQDNIKFVYDGVVETVEKLPTTITKRKVFLNALIAADLSRDGASGQADQFYNGLKASQQPKIENAVIGMEVNIQ